MPPPSFGRAPAPEPDAAQIALESADRILHGIACAARCIGCFAVVLLARNQQWFADLMTGVLLGDAVSWALAAVRDVRAHPRAVLAEGAIYGIALAIWFWLGGTLLSTDPEQRALVMLGFMGMFTVKTSWLVWTVTHGHRA